MSPRRDPFPDVAWIQSWTEPPASYLEAYEEAHQRFHRGASGHTFEKFMQRVAEHLRCLSGEVVEDLLREHGLALYLVRNPRLSIRQARAVEQWCIEAPPEKSDRTPVATLEVYVRRRWSNKRFPALTRPSLEWLKTACAEHWKERDSVFPDAFRLLLEAPGVTDTDWAEVVNGWIPSSRSWSMEASRIWRHPARGLETLRALARLHPKQLNRESWARYILLPGARQDPLIWERFRQVADLDAWVGLYHSLPPDERGALWREEVERDLYRPMQYLKTNPGELPLLLGEGEVNERVWQSLLERSDHGYLPTLCQGSSGERFREAFLRLTARHFQTAAQLLLDEALDAKEALRPQDLAPFLTHSDQQIRLSAMTALGRLARPEPVGSQPTPESPITRQR